MKITHDEVRRIAHLAHLRFDDEELDRLRGDLDRILAYVEALDALDTTGVEAASGALTGPSGSPRDDVSRPGLSPEEALANAPDAHQGHFRVPKIIA